MNIISKLSLSSVDINGDKDILTKLVGIATLEFSGVGDVLNNVGIYLKSQLWLKIANLWRW